MVLLLVFGGLPILVQCPFWGELCATVAGHRMDINSFISHLPRGKITFKPLLIHPHARPNSPHQRSPLQKASELLPPNSSMRRPLHPWSFMVALALLPSIRDDPIGPGAASFRRGAARCPEVRRPSRHLRRTVGGRWSEVGG